MYYDVFLNTMLLFLKNFYVCWNLCIPLVCPFFFPDQQVKFKKCMEQNMLVLIQPQFFMKSRAFRCRGGKGHFACFCSDRFYVYYVYFIYN